MDDVSRNRVSTLIYYYSIENNEENFKKLAQVIKKEDYYIYKQILGLIDNCWIVSEDSSGLTVEIDLYKNEKLLEDITEKFFIKKVSTRKVEGKACILSNTYLTLKVWFT